MPPVPDAPTSVPEVAAPARTGRNSALVSAGILLSRLSGLVRERTVGHYFGTGVAADAFSAAFRIPNLMQNILGEGVLSASLIPVYSKHLAEGRTEDAARLARATLGLLLAILSSLVLVVVIAAEPVTRVMAPGLGEATLDLTVTLVRIMTPAVGLLVVGAWCLAVLNSHRRFFTSYVAPVVMNVVQIAVVVAAAGLLGRAAAGGSGAVAQADLVLWLAWGTVAGAALQLLTQFVGVTRTVGIVRPTLRIRDPGVATVLRSFVPIVGARGVVQVSAFVHLLLASFLALGALSALRYSQMLYLLPVSLFGMAVAAAELPELARSRPAGSATAARLEAGMARMAFFVVPTAAAYLVIGDLLVGTAFRSGAFDGDTVRQVWIILAVYSVGLLPTTSSRLLQSALYAAGDPRTPSRVALVRVAVSLAFGVVLMFPLDHVVVSAGGLSILDGVGFGPLPASFREGGAGVERHHLGAAGLALAAGVASWAEYTLLRRAVRRHVGTSPRMGGGRLSRLVAAAAAGAAAGLVVRPFVDGLHPLLGGPVAATAFGAAYAGVALALRVPEARALVETLLRRRRHRR